MPYDARAAVVAEDADRGRVEREQRARPGRPDHAAELVRDLEGGRVPALLGAGANGLYANERVDDGQKHIAEQLFRATGLCTWIADEALMNTVTALSGSGPAYVFLLCEAMQAAAEKQGLPKETAQALAVQTFVGAAKMLSESGETPDVLRQRVTSPNGTTHAAVTVFEQGGLRLLVQTALDAATERGKALSKEND